MFHNVNTIFQNVHQRLTNPTTFAYACGSLGLSSILYYGNQVINGYDKENPDLLAELNAITGYIVLSLLTYNSCDLIYQSLSGTYQFYKNSQRQNEIDQIKKEMEKIRQTCCFEDIGIDTTYLTVALATKKVERLKYIFQKIGEDTPRLRGILKYIELIKKVDQLIPQSANLNNKFASDEINALIETQKAVLQNLDEGYAQGAALRLFPSVMPGLSDEIYMKMGNFISRKEAGRLIVSSEIREAAKNEEDHVRKKMK